MPTFKERREFGRKCSTIGTAAIRLFQPTFAAEFEHAELMRKALQTAAVELTLILGAEPLRIMGATPIDFARLVSHDEATEGLRLLGWKRLVGLHIDSSSTPLVSPQAYADLIKPDPELMKVFLEMTDLWYAAVEQHGKEDLESNPMQGPMMQYHRLVWTELQRRVYRREPNELDFMGELSVSTRLTIFSKQTADYWSSLVNGDPMPSVSNGPSWYFEQYIAFEGLGRH